MGQGMKMSVFWLPELETELLCQNKEPFVLDHLTALRVSTLVFFLETKFVSKLYLMILG